MCFAAGRPRDVCTARRDMHDKPYPQDQRAAHTCVARMPCHAVSTAKRWHAHVGEKGPNRDQLRRSTVPVGSSVETRTPASVPMGPAEPTRQRSSQKRPLEGARRFAMAPLAFQTTLALRGEQGDFQGIPSGPEESPGGRQGTTKDFRGPRRDHQRHPMRPQGASPRDPIDAQRGLQGAP